MLRDVLIPMTGHVGYWPHRVDMYIPEKPPLRALVSLHGGGGTKEFQARSLQVISVNPPTVQNVNWDLLDIWEFAAVFPQGQACSSINSYEGNPANPHGADTVSVQRPNGIPTWGTPSESFGGFHYSGYNDFEFLTDLRKHIPTVIPSVQAVHMHGHSAGGIMCHLYARNANAPVGNPARYNTFSVTSGTRENNALAMNNDAPFFWQCGALDNILGIIGGIPGPGSHWNEPVWRQLPDRVSKINVLGKIVNAVWTPIPAYHEACPLTWSTCSGESYNYGDAVISTTTTGVTVRTWDSADKRYRMRLVNSVGHQLYSQQLVTGEFVISNIFRWIRDMTS